MTDLVEWLLARITEDEAVATQAAEAVGSTWGHSRWGSSVYDDATGGVFAVGPAGESLDEPARAHICGWDPARVLAECAAKRQLVALHSDDDELGAHECPDSVRTHPANHNTGFELICLTLKLLAQPYKDQPGWQPEWNIA